jgi:hypothetical protein
MSSSSTRPHTYVQQRMEEGRGFDLGDLRVRHTPSAWARHGATELREAKGRARHMLTYAVLNCPSLLSGHHLGMLQECSRETFITEA